MIQIRLSRTYKFHLLAFGISMILAIISISHLLFSDQSLMPEHRDVVSPKNKDFLTEKMTHLWTQYGSVPDYESVARSWYMVFLLFSPNVATFLRIYFLLGYLLTFFLSYLSFFYLSKNLLKFTVTKAFVLASIAAFLYSFNPFTLQAFSPPTTYTLAYAFLPIILLLNIQLLKNDNFLTKLLFAIAITLVITQIPRYAIFIVIEIFLVTIFYLILYRRTLRLVLDIAKKYCLVLALILPINAYWLLPTLFISISSAAPSPSYVVTYESVKIFSESFNMYDILTLKAAWWPYLELNLSISDIDFSILIIVLPLLAFIPFLFSNKASKDELFLLLIGSTLVIIGAFLSQGLNTQTFTLIYNYLAFSTPGYLSWMFRVPGHFLTLVVFGYVINTVIILRKIIEIEKIHFLKVGPLKVNGNSLRIILMLMLISAIGAISWQRFTGDLDGILQNGYHPRQVNYFSNIPFQRAIVLLDDNYAGKFQAHQTGKPYITIPEDMRQYLVDSTKGKNINSLVDTMSAVRSDAIITNLELPSGYSNYFSKFYLADFGVAVYVLHSSNEKFYIPSMVMETQNMKRTYLDSLGPDGFANSTAIATESVPNGFSKMIINPEKSPMPLKNGDGNTVIIPFNYVTRYLPDKYWSKAASSDPLHGSWHVYLETILGIRNWQTDYGYGIVFTNAKDILHIPFQIKKSGTYDLLVRYFESKEGGLTRFKVDSSYVRELSTESMQNRFVWKKLGSLQLDEGSHILNISNLRGFNAVNIMVIAPTEENAYGIPDSLSPVYVFEAETDLTTNERVKSKGLEGINNGEPITYSSDRRLSQSIDITKGGLYRFTVQSTGEAILRIDNKSFTIESSHNNTVNTPSFYLKKGKHNLQIELLGGEKIRTIRWSFENNNTIDEWRSLNEEFTVSNDTARFDLWESVPGWNVINFPLVPSNHEFEQSWNFGIKCHHCYSPHIKIVEYNSKKKEAAVSVFYELPQDGDFDWKDVHIHYMPKSADVAYTQMQIWHGYKTNMTLPNQIWLKNVSYMDTERYLSDTIWLYFIDKPDQTLNEIVSGARYAEITGYQMINPTLYKVKVKGNGPLLLAFAETYNPLWTATINGKQVRSIPIYSLINGFPIEDIEGEATVDIEYSPQKWLYYGSAISITALGIFIVYNAYGNTFRNNRGHMAKLLFTKFKKC
jgi:hypothetical protein